MNKQNLIILIIVVVLAIVCLSCFYALGMNSSSDDNSTDNIDAKTINFKGIIFRIPEGFIEDSTNKNSKEIEGITYPTTIKNYHGDNKTISILIAEDDNYNITDNTAKLESNGTKENINGINGYLKYTSAETKKFITSNSVVTIKIPAYYTFSYEKDGKLVSITVSDKNLLSEILI